MKQDSVEQRDGHEALLRMVRANHLVVGMIEDRLRAETRRLDVHCHQLEEIRQLLRNMGLAMPPGLVESSLR